MTSGTQAEGSADQAREQDATLELFRPWPRCILMLVQVNEKPFEDLKHCMASLTKGVVKFAQVPQAQRFVEVLIPLE